YGNEGGDFYGTWGPMPNDVFADPQFCNAGEFDFTVSAESPCAPGMTPGCGAIGAWGVGCGGIAVEQTSWGQIKALYR
ncbi:MAG TPA: hypothetical protein VFR10_01795, partial [bacterium]|nr:hypothetical protein [bacterium]